MILGKSHRALNKIESAMAAFQTAYLIQPHSPATELAKHELMEIKLSIAEKAHKVKSYNTAFSAYQEILAIDSTSFRANYQLGIAYQENNWLDKAAFYFKRAQTINSENKIVPLKLAAIDSLINLAEANFQKGVKYYLQNNNSSAVRYLKMAIDLKDDFKQAKYYYHLARGKILYKKGSQVQLWDAIEMFGNAMMIRPESAEPHYYLAISYEKKDSDEFDNAINEYKIALEKEPNGPYAKKCADKIKELTSLRDKLKAFWGK